MKKILALILTLCMVSALGASAFAEAEEPVELVVFAAASMTETLTEIADLYKEVAPNVTLVYNFDSSGTLKTQIQEGADCDVFISAAPKQMNQLDISKDDTANPDRLDFVRRAPALTCWKTRSLSPFRMETRKTSTPMMTWLPA